MKALWLPIPPAQEQDAIANYLDRETTKIDRMVEKVEAANARLREYRTALITAAATGKIDVLGLSPNPSSVDTAEESQTKAAVAGRTIPNTV